jgi:hypothetical protein
MVQPIVASMFGPRVGHEMLSGVTTSHTPLWVADAHRASSLELLLTKSSDRQLVLTSHDLHQLLAKTYNRPDHTSPPDTPTPESRWKVSTGADDRVSSKPGMWSGSEATTAYLSEAWPARSPVKAPRRRRNLFTVATGT